MMCRNKGVLDATLERRSTVRKRTNAMLSISRKRRNPTRPEAAVATIDGGKTKKKDCADKQAKAQTSSLESGRELKRRQRANVIILGKGTTARAIATACERFGCEPRRRPDADEAIESVDWNTATLVVVPPIANKATLDVCARLRRALGNAPHPIFAVIAGEVHEDEARSLYNEVTGVFAWPAERSLFFQTLCRVLSMSNGRLPRDQKLTRAVQKRLETDKLADETTRAAVFRGIARLDGEVSAMWRIREMEKAAMSVPDITDVISEHLTVRDWGLTDRQVARATRQMIRNTSDVDDKSIAVSVKEGIVTMAGDAVSRDELCRLRSLVEHVRGVRGIANVATIAPQSARKNRQVAKKLRERLDRQKGDIDVSVFGGVAVLSGYVESAKDKYAARETALRVDGVHRVADKLEIRQAS
jgi:osmotically-inducible protein OsmY